MTYNRLLGKIGRTKRRECAKQVAEKIAVLLAEPPKDVDGMYSVVVLNKKHLQAFRRHASVRPPTARLKKLTDRVRNELHTMGYNTLVDFDYVARGGRLYHLGVHAQLINVPQGTLI